MDLGRVFDSVVHASHIVLDIVKKRNIGEEKRWQFAEAIASIAEAGFVDYIPADVERLALLMLLGLRSSYWEPVARVIVKRISGCTVYGNNYIIVSGDERVRDVAEKLAKTCIIVAALGRLIAAQCHDARRLIIVENNSVVRVYREKIEWVEDALQL